MYIYTAFIYTIIMTISTSSDCILYGSMENE
jgi:hypothetical protein